MKHFTENMLSLIQKCINIFLSFVIDGNVVLSNRMGSKNTKQCHIILLAFSAFSNIDHIPDVSANYFRHSKRGFRLSFTAVLHSAIHTDFCVDQFLRIQHITKNGVPLSANKIVWPGYFGKLLFIPVHGFFRPWQDGVIVNCKHF